MTEQIGEHGLFCISDTDYAAIAMSMQCNAQAIEDALVAVSEPIDSAAARPWIHVTNAQAISVDDTTGGGSVGPFGLVGELMRPTTFGNVIVQANNMPTTSFGVFLPEGIFLIGTSVSWTLAAATANSIRQLLVYGIREINGIVASRTGFTDLFRNQDYQGDGGNNGALMTAGLLDTRAGNVATVEAFFSHTNVAGNLTIAAGAWKLWAVYLGAGSSL